MLTPLLVLSAVADGTLATQLFTGFFKALVAAGFPATLEGLGGLICTVLVAGYTRWSTRRGLKKIVAEHVAELGVGPPPAPKRKRKKINV